jgi:beta-phosphoglucomutase family hydrolase
MQIGVIFDWDGVVIDSSRMHEESWDRLAEEVGKPLPAGHFKAGFGRKNQYIIPNILQWTHDDAEIERLGQRKEELYREILRETGLETLPGVRELLDSLREHAIPCAVGSSTPRKNLDTSFALLGLADYFTAVISADNVSHGKPHPEVFLKAAEALGIPPAQCVVIEDAHVGIEAALAGGMKVVGVATTHPIDSLEGAHHRVHRLTEITYGDLLALFKR